MLTPAMMPRAFSPRFVLRLDSRRIAPGWRFWRGKSGSRGWFSGPRQYPADKQMRPNIAFFTF